MDEIPKLASNESRFHSPAAVKGTSVTLHLQVPDAESVWRQALGIKHCNTHERDDQNSRDAHRRAPEDREPMLSRARVRWE